MAKPLGPKSKLIRDAIKAHPDLGNTELAEMINSSDARQHDKISVKASDIAAQRQAMKKQGKTAPAAAGKKKGGKQPPAEAAPAKPEPPRAVAPSAPAANPVALIDSVFDLARQCGGFEQLKKLVDRLAEMR
jgi:hypothetical protein